MKTELLKRIMELCLSLEDVISDEHHIPDIEIKPGEMIVNYPLLSEEGKITFSLFKKIVSYESIHNINKYKLRLGHYLLGYLLITSPDDKIIGFGISPYGIKRRRGERDGVEKELNNFSKEEFSIGGRPSQLIHLNYGFCFKYIELDKLFNDLSHLDAEQDFFSDSNDDDSEFSKLAILSLESWESTEEFYLKIRNIIDEAYVNFYDCLSPISTINWYLDRYQKADDQNKEGLVMRMKELRNDFLKAYDELYNKTLSKVRAVRSKLKEKLVQDFYKFIGSLTQRVNQLIDDQVLRGKYSHNIINSRGLKEIEFLINDFDPYKAGIPLPSPDKVSQKIKPLIENYKLLFGYNNSSILFNGTRKSLKETFSKK